MFYLMPFCNSPILTCVWSSNWLSLEHIRKGINLPLIIIIIIIITIIIIIIIIQLFFSYFIYDCCGANN